MAKKKKKVKRDKPNFPSDIDQLIDKTYKKIERFLGFGNLF